MVFFPRFLLAAGRSPYGERGLKFEHAEHGVGGRAGRSPYGECGLKCLGRPFRPPRSLSLSLRRAWIEMLSASNV